MQAITSFFTHAADALLGVSLGALAIAILLHLVKVAAEARSWHAIVAHAYRDVRFRVTFGAFAGAIGANAFLPGKIGEALRLAIVRRRTRNSCSSTIAATMLLETAIESVFSVAVVCAVLLAGQSVGSVGAPLDGLSRLAANRPVLAAAGLVLVAAAVATVRFRAPLRRVAGDMATGFAVVRAPRTLIHPVLSWKLVAWALRLATVYWFLRAFHIDATPWTVLIVVAAQMAAALVPLLPGNAGTQQAALVVGLSGTASAATVIGFGVGMQAATGIADVLLGALAVALVAPAGEIRAALAVRRRARLARA
jgi:uncharacterized membrane protein YbhN (UPF0104 family)